MSHPLRAPLVQRFGPKGFMLVYSAVSLVTFVWMVVEFGRAPKAEGLWAVGDGIWVVASLLTLIAAVLLSGSFIRNPSLPGVPAAFAAQPPFGVFMVTRHPMMWGIALWGIAHILVAPRPDNFIFMGSLIFLALAGSKAQEMKKRAMLGGQWADHGLQVYCFGPSRHGRTLFGASLGRVSLGGSAFKAGPFSCPARHNAALMFRRVERLSQVWRGHRRRA